MPDFLERRALRIVQNPDLPLYLFALAAEEIDLVADVARISRDAAGKLLGYQRPEKRNHVRQILEYLDSGDVLFPNGLNPGDSLLSRSEGPKAGVDCRWPAAESGPRTNAKPQTGDARCGICR